MTLLKLRETDVHWREIDGEIIALTATADAERFVDALREQDLLAE